MLALAATDETYETLVQRLSQASVRKHFDAYTDVPWDDRDSQIDPEDPRWELQEYEPLGATGWYRAQPARIRSRIGLDMAAARMKLGIDFENILSRGLLEYAATRPNGSPEFRYAYHELIEEGQHSLMFQEFVNRSGAAASGIYGARRWIGRMIPRLGRTAPELFFTYVLAGEMPIDSVQRRELRCSERHPLLRRIMQIHVTEEARHVCFAENYLAAHVPLLSRVSLARLRVMAPFITAETAKIMLQPPPWLQRQHRIPGAVMADVKYAGPAHLFLADAVQPLVEKFWKLGLITSTTLPVWHALGLTPPAPQLGSGHQSYLSR